VGCFKLPGFVYCHTMKQRVLVVCTGNSCRSQMAEGFLRRFSNSTMEVFSAGTHPCFVHPLAIAVMREVGVDISKHRSKFVDEFLGQRFDYVITVCDNAKEACPVFPGAKRTVHMLFADPVQYIGPEEERLRCFRRVRDEIASRMKDFLSQIGIYSVSEH